MLRTVSANFCIVDLHYKLWSLICSILKYIEYLKCIIIYNNAFKTIQWQSSCTCNLDHWKESITWHLFYVDSFLLKIICIGISVLKMFLFLWGMFFNWILLKAHMIKIPCDVRFLNFCQFLKYIIYIFKLQKLLKLLK